MKKPKSLVKKMNNVLIKNIIKYLNGFNTQLLITDEKVAEAFEKTITDVKYHYPTLTSEEICSRIINNNNELAIYLYRLGRIYFKMGDNENINILHGLMRMTCSCEIYFSNIIGHGFYLVHSVGTVIGSRNKIGNGFLVYQNCTIGHENDNQNGAKLGDEITMLPYSSIIGSICIGDNVILGAYTLIKNDCESNNLISGIPGKKISKITDNLKSRFRPNL
jgi:serine O-acetyltransferase